MCVCVCVCARAQVYSSLGEAYGSVNKFRESSEALLHAYNIADTHIIDTNERKSTLAPLAYNLAYAYDNVNMRPLSEKYFQHAIQHDAGFTNAHVKLAHIYQVMHHMFDTQQYT